MTIFASQGVFKMLSIVILDDNKSILEDYKIKIPVWLKKNKIKGNIFHTLFMGGNGISQVFGGNRIPLVKFSLYSNLLSGNDSICRFHRSLGSFLLGNSVERFNLPADKKFTEPEKGFLAGWYLFDIIGNSLYSWKKRNSQSKSEKRSESCAPAG